MNLLPLAVKLASTSMSLNIKPIKPMKIGDFKIEIIYPKFIARVEMGFAMSEIKFLVEKINNKHCS